MKKLLLLSAILILSTFNRAVSAQGTGSGNIVAEAATCIQTVGATQNCVQVSVPNGVATASVTISGTFSISALKFETVGPYPSTFESVLCTPYGSTTAVTSASAAGKWFCNVAAAQYFQVRADTGSYTSGTAVIGISLSTGSAPASSTGGGGSSTNATIVGPLGNQTPAASVAVTANGQGAQTAANSTSVVPASNSGNFPVQGPLTNNNAAPGANNLGVLPSVANAANPTLVEGDQALDSLDLNGRKRVFNPDLTGTGTITVVCASINSCAANSTVQIATSGYSGASVVVTLNSGTGTFNFDRSVDGGSTWKNDFAACWTATSARASITASDTCVLPVPSGTSHVRVRASACSSCNVTVATRATVAGPGVPIVFGSSGEAAFVATPNNPSAGNNTFPGVSVVSSATISDGAGSSAAAPTNSGSPAGMANFLYNNASWDRQRGVTPSATVGITCSACTSTQTGSDQTNYNGRGVKCVYDATTVTSSGSFTLEIDAKDEVSGKYYSLLTGAAVSTVSTNVYTVYPGITVTANQSSSDVLPRIWRVKTTYNSGTNQTFTVGCSVIL